MIARWLSTIPVAMSVVLFVIVPLEAEAESTRLRLDPVPRLVIGEYATFTGSLVTGSGHALMRATVDIKDDDPGFDDLIASVSTGSDGRFSARVLVKDWDRRSSTVEIYAVYEGGNGFSKSRSATQEAYVLPSSASGTNAQPLKASTRITLFASESSIYAGQTITFSGQLTSGGAPLSGATIHIKEDDPLWRDEFLASTKTDRQGRYSVDWRASAGLVETDFDVYAVFEETKNYLRSVTRTYTLPVYKYSGDITMDPLPRSVHIGDPVTFSGRLMLQGTDTTNVIVYIMDEDTAGPDDLIATAYVDRNGYYAVTWTAHKVDSDSVADIYAVFEGDSTHYRLTTCDDGPTRFFGGLCRDTIPLSTLPPRAYNPPGPPDSEYMALNYVIEFIGRPTVAIAPSPEAYDQVRPYIIPAREGLETLSSELAAKHSGDWFLNYEVLERGKWRADSRADIVLNLITGDQDTRCDSSGGWAPLEPKALPIQINVCVTTGQHLRYGHDVMRTATHEFIHAVGAGHTFNKQNDMMCSVEEGKKTCPGSYSTREYRPSALTLEAMAALYGRDGYAVPNNGVTNTYFVLGGGHTPTATRVGTQATTATWSPFNDGQLVLEKVPTRTFSELASYIEGFGYFGPMIEFLNDKFVLPHDITVSLQECGMSPSSYDQASKTIRVCYERVADYVDVTHELDFDDDYSYAYVFNNVDFELYRGLGYALSHVHDLPTFGYGVHMADSFAAYAKLTFYDDPAIGQKIMHDAFTQMYVQSGYGEGTTASHVQDLERFHRITCYTYGQDTESNAYIVTGGWLPEYIGGSCTMAYATMVDIWDTALLGYMHGVY